MLESPDSLKAFVPEPEATDTASQLITSGDIPGRVAISEAVHAGDVVPHVTDREPVPLAPNEVGPIAVKRAQGMLPPGQVLARTEDGFSVISIDGIKPESQ